MVRPGIELLLSERMQLLQGQRVGIITNHTGVDHRLRSTVELLGAQPGLQVAALFAGEHGIYGDLPAGALVQDARDPRSGIPIRSLYGTTKRPDAAMLADLDLLVFDMQDSGARFFTYTWTMTLCMQAAAEHGKRFVVLDRPNPIGGIQTEGGLLQPGFESFVGLYPVPTRHGLTIGEIARLCNERYGIGCDLEVVPCAGWQRSHWWDQTGLPFVPPSPNSNALEMLALYPGTCFFEGTNLSEGRGTTLPFQLFGAPWLQERQVIAELEHRRLPGVAFRPTYFTPWYSKYAGQLCRGVQLHISDRQALRPVALGAQLLDVCRRLHPEQFAWADSGGKQTPRAIDRLSGSDLLRTTIDAGQAIDKVLEVWQDQTEQFAPLAAEVRLYH